MPTKTKPLFALRLRALREREGMTQQDLADRAGLHSMAISKLELSLRAPTWDTVQRLATALGATTEDFRK